MAEMKTMDRMTDDDNAPGRRPWQHLDLLLSQAEKHLSDADHNDVASLQQSLSYLTELSDTVQRELDYLIISLREHWHRGYDDIAYQMGRPWEHDLSHLLVPLHDPELSPGWRAAKRRYREALKRQFGPGTPVPSYEYFNLFRDAVEARLAIIAGRDPAEGDPSGDPMETASMASLRRQRRVITKLRKRGVLPEGIRLSSGFGAPGQPDVIRLHDEKRGISEAFPIEDPIDPAHPFVGVEQFVLEVVRRAQQLADESAT